MEQAAVGPCLDRQVPSSRVPSLCLDTRKLKSRELQTFPSSVIQQMQLLGGNQLTWEFLILPFHLVIRAGQTSSCSLGLD